MAKKRIFTVGFEAPGDEFEYIRFESDQSLLDADIVLYETGFGELYPPEDYEGERLFSKSQSPRVAQYLAHWRAELTAFVTAGKLAIVYLRKPLRYHRYTGEKKVSGTGRSQVTTNLVTSVSSYSAVPVINKVEAKTGTEVKLHPKAAFLLPYWKEVAPLAPYEAYIEGQFSHRLIVTKAGDKIVGAAAHANGWLLFLPSLSFDEKKFVKFNAQRERVWSADALKFGKRFLATLVALSNALSLEGTKTPPPAWALESSLVTNQESEIQASIAKITNELVKLQQKRTTLEQKLVEAGELRGLLFETGLQLEKAVREALTLFGFSAKNVKESQSEFDVVFESAEGRFLGEVEGKDTRVINIDKLSQLERNLHEDYARDEVTDFAKGVLFGNPERLVKPQERSEWFTAKCVSAAQRAGIALVRTPDMFGPARYLRETTDGDFAARCRRAIFDAAGQVVVFPTPPVKTETETVSSEE